MRIAIKEDRQDNGAVPLSTLKPGDAFFWAYNAHKLTGRPELDADAICVVVGLDLNVVALFNEFALKDEKRKEVFALRLATNNIQRWGDGDEVIVFPLELSELEVSHKYR